MCLEAQSAGNINAGKNHTAAFGPLPVNAQTEQ